MHKQEIAFSMKENFENHIEIPENFEYVPDSKLSNILDTKFDGYGFTSKSCIVYVDCQNLPERFSIVAIRKNGNKSAFETHDSTKAAKKVTELMNKF